MTDSLTPDDLAQIEERYGLTASRHILARAPEVEPTLLALAESAEDVPRLVRALREAWYANDMERHRTEVARVEILNLLDNWARRAERAEAERDRLRAQVEAVRALADEWDAGKVVNRAAMDQGIWCPYEPPGPDDIRTALDAQQPATATTSTPDGSEGGGGENGAQIAADDFEACGRSICWLPGGHDGDCDPGGGCGLTTVTEPCGDRITTWHGRFGPCVQVGQHALHDDGAGAVWSWSEPTTTGEKP